MEVISMYLEKYEKPITRIINVDDVVTTSEAGGGGGIDEDWD